MTTFLLVVVVLPIAAVVWKSTGNGWSGFWEVVSSPQAVAALKLSVITATLAVLTTAVFGTIIAWVLVRDSFAGKSLVNAIIDLPFALPTIVAGLVIMALYGPRTPLDVTIGSFHFDADITFTRTAIYVALLFVTLPFVVRTVQPVLIELDRELEDAARSLGASGFTTFRRIVLPAILPGVLSGVAMAFARRGYAVVAVMRRGFGTTGGGFAEAPGRCDDRVYLRASKSAARDVLGAVDALSKETWVDPSRVVLVGHSAGGMAVLAAAAMGSAHASPRIVAVISFAGGRGSDAPDHVCQPERLVESLRVFGRDAKAPSLWVYAENDHFFSPAFARSMFDGYRSSGAPAELAMVPPFGAEGHAFFTAAPVDRWWPVVEPFLAGQHLPTAVTHPRAPVTLAPPEVLTPAGRDAWAAYLASESVEKAFATGGARWGWSAGRRTQKDAIERAVSNCEKHGQGEPCKVVAIGDAYAP